MSVDKDLRQFLEKLMAFSNKTGIAYRTGDIYGGLAGFWDYGPIGVEIKNRIKNAWWNDFVRNRDDIVGYEGAIITHPKVWEASGHLSSFTDPLVFCEGRCKKKYRLDHIIEDQLKVHTENLHIKEMGQLIADRGLKCPDCGGKLSSPMTFNLMFSTQVGPVKDSSSVAYLRPENAQLIFSGFQNVVNSTRLKIPFGIAQSGIAFRNEISPRNFLFRTREFELMEFEYFTNPEKTNDCPIFDEVASTEINIYSRHEQEQDSVEDYVSMSLQDAWNKKIFKNKWQAYWLTTFHVWFTEQIGINGQKLRFRQHMESELSHYALDTWDIEYKYLFGWKELMGCANRTQYDLEQQQKFSKSKMQFSETDDKGMQRYTPYVVAEPSVGLGRILLTVIADGYKEEVVKDRKRVVLKIHPRLAPYDVAVFPLKKKNEEIYSRSIDLFKSLRKEGFIAKFDENGSIGKRYRRHDEIGTPFCVTIDFETLTDKNITVRERDSMKQTRVPITELSNKLLQFRQEYKFTS